MEYFLVAVSLRVDVLFLIPSVESRLNRPESVATLPIPLRRQRR